MRFQETALPGAYVVDVEPAEDERGLFARTWCAEEFQSHGLRAEVAQCSVSYNARAGTIRGLHFQRPPHAETKLVRCTRGRVFDVIVDVRRDSPTYLRWVAYELSDDDRRSLYVPEGCAHGFQALVDGAELLYQISTPYHPDAATGLRWDDPRLAIPWPLPVSSISDRDRRFELLRADSTDPREGFPR